MPSFLGPIRRATEGWQPWPNRTVKPGISRPSQCSQFTAFFRRREGHAWVPGPIVPGCWQRVFPVAMLGGSGPEAGRVIPHFARRLRSERKTIMQCQLATPRISQPPSPSVRRDTARCHGVGPCRNGSRSGDFGRSLFCPAPRRPKPAEKKSLDPPAHDSSPRPAAPMSPEEIYAHASPAVVTLKIYSDSVGMDSKELEQARVSQGQASFWPIDSPSLSRLTPRRKSSRLRTRKDFAEFDRRREANLASNLQSANSNKKIVEEGDEFRKACEQAFESGLAQSPTSLHRNELSCNRLRGKYRSQDARRLDGICQPGHSGR